jgi:uncharacterized protein with von Willebrand factor type A (vWA) domain
VTDTFAVNLVHFVRYLRVRGLPVVPQTARDLASAALVVGLERRDDVYAAFRAVAILRQADVAVFDEAFELFFGDGVNQLSGLGEEGATTRRDPRRGTVTLPVLKPAGAGAADEVVEVAETVGGSYSERLRSRDFGDLTPGEQEAVRRLIAAMVWRPADTRSRRWGTARRGPQPDLRRTFRHLTRPEGDLLPLALVDRRPRRRPLVVLADVSGSMERYSELFLHFIHAAQGRLGRVEAFVFATRLTRITREMRRRLPREAIARVGATVEDWSGGTRIGEALADFNRHWSRRVTRGGAIGLVISDGWDTGDPALLRDEMARFARSMHRVVWLNPHAGREGFVPATRGMRTVLPYVDDFLAAATVEHLVDVVRLLESVPRSRPSVRSASHLEFTS